MPIDTAPDDPAGIVNWATVTSLEGPSDGLSQNTAPSVELMPIESVQLAKSSPTLPRTVSGSPSCNPTVSHESNSETGELANSVGLTPPTFAPNGASTWYAAGMVIGEAGVPNIVYKLVAPSESVAVSLYVMPDALDPTATPLRRDGAARARILTHLRRDAVRLDPLAPHNTLHDDTQ